MTSELERRLSEATAERQWLVSEVDDFARFICGPNFTFVDWGEVRDALHSIDAALALKDRLLPGQAAAVGDMAFTADPRGPWATIWTLEGSPKWNATAATPALAICLALIRALATNPQSEKEPTNV